MGALDDYKPALFMLGMQFIYAAVTLSTRAALLEGMSPRVFVVYRQAAATLIFASLSYLTRRNRRRCSLGWRTFSLIFLATFIGVTINQNAYFEGLYLASSSTATAMGNLVPAITFFIAAIFGLEKVNTRNLRSIAKIIGTILCVGGAVSMALLKGPELLNTDLRLTSSFFGSGDENWLLGCFLLFASSWCWSIWLMLQVPISANYHDHLSLSALMCFIATLQCATATFFLEHDLGSWKLNSYLQIIVCLWTGFSSGLTYFAQAWCVSQRGPHFTAMFNPLNAIIVTIIASIFQHEELYTGSLVGAVAVITGLYVVLWGNAKQNEDISKDDTQTAPTLQTAEAKIVDVLESSDSSICKIDLKEPLLCDK